MEYSLFHIDDCQSCITLPIEQLDQIEKARYRTAGRAYLLLRSLLKQEIAKRLHLSATEVHFAYNEQGKPYLPEHPQLHFNMSHTGDYIAIAFDTQPIGIDIELMKQRKFPRIAKRIMPEHCYLQFLESGASAEEFYMYWCACEALIKQAGSSIWQAEHYPFSIEQGSVILPEDSPLSVEIFSAAHGVMGAVAQCKQ